MSFSETIIAGTIVGLLVLVLWNWILIPLKNYFQAKAGKSKDKTLSIPSKRRLSFLSNVIFIISLVAMASLLVYSYVDNNIARLLVVPFLGAVIIILQTIAIYFYRVLNLFISKRSDYTSNNENDNQT